VGNLQLVVWAVVPPLLVLAYYYRRVPSAPALPRLLLCFVVGALLGFVALGLEWGFEHLGNWVVDWDRITQSLAGIALRQLVEVGPIEEGSKLGGVILLQWQRRRPTRPNTIFLFTTAIALGFTAEENWVYLANQTASIIDRLVGTPVHALFSAPWGYALGVASCSGRYRGMIARAWVNSIACHALVNVLSSAWRYSSLSFLSYGLFPFLLWMFWRMEGLVRRLQRKPPIVLISGSTPIHRYWQLGLALFALILGGNAIFGLFLLARSLSPLNLSQLFYPDIWWFIVSRFLFNLIPGLIAWGIYRYLRHSASHRYP
jgi:RsiW-degrading membrane proteinase PrsW (M82 family)